MRLHAFGFLVLLSAAAVTTSAPLHAQSNDHPGKTATGRIVNGVPSDALGLCNDGTYVSTGSRDYACSARGGLKKWYLDGDTPAASSEDHPAPGKKATGRIVNGVPSDALGLCKDGTYVSTGMKDTACSAHGGMKIWYLDGTPQK